MTLTTKDIDRLLAALQAAALRVIQERQLTLRTPAQAYTGVKEGGLIVHLVFAPVADAEP